VESRWRSNVWRLGWSGGPYRLIARSVAFPNAAITDRLVSGVFRETLFNVSLNPDDFSQAILGAALPITPHFPYGFAVEPD